MVARPSCLITKWQVRNRPLSYELRETRAIKTP